MPSYDALLRDLREIDSRDRRRRALAGASARPTVIDCREADEHAQGAIPGAIWIPRGFLESRIEKHVADRAHADRRLLRERQPLAVRRADAAASSATRTCARSPAGSPAWKRAGLPWEMPAVLRADQETRYSRHVLLPEVGVAGQRKLLDGEGAAASARAASARRRACTSRRPASARSASSTTTSSTRRTSSARSSTGPTGSARPRSTAPSRRSAPQPGRARRSSTATRLTSRTRSSCSAATTSIVDGADNFATRYLVNDVALRLDKPVVHASIFRFEGQLTVFPADGAPCYRCLYPEPPPPEEAPSCAEAGVLGVLPGIMGVLQATEAIKLILGLGETLAGRLLVYDALADGVPRAQAAPRSEVPDVRRRRRSRRDRAHRLRPVLRGSSAVSYN